MIPSKSGQIVKFQTPLPDEDPDLQYIIIEITSNSHFKRASIMPLNTGITYPPINTVMLKDLIVVGDISSDKNEV